MGIFSMAVGSIPNEHKHVIIDFLELLNCVYCF